MKRSSIPGVAAVVAGWLAAGCGMAPSSTALTQIGGWVAPASGREQFELSELRGLPPWTLLHVFGPYTSAASIEQALGFSWRDAEGYRLERRDDMHLAVFVSGSRVVHVEEWRRSRFDCDRSLTDRPLAAGDVIRIERAGSVPRLTRMGVGGPGGGG